MRPGVAPRSDAERGSRAHGPRVEGIGKPEDPVPREVPRIHAERRGRSCVDRPGHRSWSVHHTGTPVRCDAAGRPARLRSVPGSGAQSFGRRLISATHLRRLSVATGAEPERADAHHREPHDGTATAVRPQPSRRVQEHRQAAHFASRRGRLRNEPGGVQGGGPRERHVLQHLLQRARDALRWPGLRVRRPRHAERQRGPQGQHLRPRERKVGEAKRAVYPS